MIIIVDYGMGNLGAINNMLKKIGVPCKISCDPSDIKEAAKLILPGVGAFDTGMENLVDRGLADLIIQSVRVQKKPLLGICLGMQLLTDSSEEGNRKGLGLLEGKTVRFNFNSLKPRPKIPHMGWNTVKILQKDPLFYGLEEENRFYFVHSFHVLCKNKNHVLGSTRYGYDFSAALASENVMGVQFHPEKSHKFGMKLLTNFAERI